FLLMPPRPSSPSPFPYTTLFRSPLRRHVDVSPRGPAAPLRDAPRVSRLFVERTGEELRTRAGASGGARRGRGRFLRPDSTHAGRSEEHTSELQSRENLVCRLLLE